MMRHCSISSAGMSNLPVDHLPQDPASWPRTLIDKIWARHLVDPQDDGTCLIYIDRHLIHELRPQAVEGLHMSGRIVRRPALSLAVPDHNVPTALVRDLLAGDPEGQIQIDLLRANAENFGIPFFDIDDPARASSTSSDRSRVSR